MNLTSGKNKFGLSRDIPDGVKRMVRQRCGFGCVICGNAFYNYEHFSPDFVEAQEHLPEGITLLCGGCHGKVTRGFWSKEKVAQADKAPKCKERGFSWEAFDLGLPDIKVLFGNTTFERVDTIIRVEGEPLLAITSPEVSGGPFQLSGIFCDENEKEILRIDKNEMRGSPESWDTEIVGSRVTVRAAKGDISLILRTEPRDKIIIEQINMTYKGCRIFGKVGGFFSVQSGGSRLDTFNCHFSNLECGYDVRGGSISLGTARRSV